MNRQETIPETSSMTGLLKAVSGRSFSASGCLPAGVLLARWTVDGLRIDMQRNVETGCEDGQNQKAGLEQIQTLTTVQFAGAHGCHSAIE